MVELIGDVCAPSELILPQVISGANNKLQPTISGAIFLSGGKIVFHNGTAFETVTSA
ncbi:MAG: hypothetical protein ACTSR1_01035 [Candidatus Heimdallarchaeota archaeon]